MRSVVLLFYIVEICIKENGSEAENLRHKLGKFWMSPISPRFHRALHRDNVSVNLFVVNKPWLFSLLWCAGVDSITTNDCQLLQQMQYPLWLIVRTLELSLSLISNLLFPLNLSFSILIYPYETLGVPGR